MRPGPLTSTRPGKRAIAAAVVALLLAAVPGDDLRAQRIDDAPAEPPASLDDILQWLGSAAERLQQAVTRAKEREEQIAALKGDTGNLGEAASKAIRQWPTAHKADPGWEWARVLVFLMQSALAAQGYDPGKPDGLMGPNTMMALLAWHAKRRDPMDIGIVATVTYLLHATLEAKGLEPGPREEILGPGSEAALKRWDGIFHSGAVIAAAYGVDFSLTRSMVEAGFERDPPPDAGNSGNESAEAPPTDSDASDYWDTSRRAQEANHCVKLVKCPNRWGILGNCFRNTCSNPITISYCLPDSKYTTEHCDPENLAHPGTAAAYFDTGTYVEPGEEKIFTHQGGRVRYMACVDVPRQSGVYHQYVGNRRWICRYPESCESCIPYYR